MLRCVFLLLCLALVPALHAQPRDGQLFDQGRAMTERSPRANAALDRMKPLLGQWDVTLTTHPTDTTTFEAQGQAEVTYMNRGYAYQERLHVPGYDEAGHSADVMAFLVYTPAQQQWGLGEASSYTEHIELYNGSFQGDDLVLTTAVRRLGGMLLTHYRVTYAFNGDEAFTRTLEASTDGGTTWMPEERRQYTRRASAPDFLVVREDAGAAAPGLPEEARQFDFLLGTWDAAHRINLGGQWVQFPTTTTAVHALGGHGILEHSWFDLDPNLPDAATTILRLYNRAERRWESLYLANRGNSLLDFGGQWEGDQMVLHSFDTRLTDTISRFVFHSIEPDRYQWYAENSTDRGQTFNETWTIDIRRRETAQ